MDVQASINSSLSPDGESDGRSRRMTLHDLPGEVDPRFSSPGATATSPSDVEQLLSESGIYWLSTVRKSGQLHSTPLAAVYHDHSIYFATGEQEQKARNLEHNRNCTITTGSSDFWSGLDVVIEGRVTRITDRNAIAEIATELERKYQGFFGFTPGEGVIINGAGGEALVYRLDARKVLAFKRGEAFSQTRWRVDETES